MSKNKKGELGWIALLSFLFSSLLIVSAAVLNSTSNANLPNITIPSPINSIENQNINFPLNLAKVFNEDNLDFDREIRAHYLDEHKNFSDLNFKKITDRDESIFMVGAKNDNIKGFNVNKKNFALHLMYCDSYNRYCIFKINGIPTKRLFSFKEFEDTKTNSFDLDESYKMKINFVEFDFCDNRRFCHLGYEGYHVVNISIERKNG